MLRKCDCGERVFDVREPWPWVDRAADHIPIVEGWGIVVRSPNDDSDWNRSARSVLREIEARPAKYGDE